ncbi:conserved unknown protein [Ectocarpus siliculosus]|uniref:Zn(2)-C6 fungal-type domain-containing protein n=1 Tax=Ectocarpus siliculosus TaxID=2880 RepID=D8LS52_ECTSI|nr:conserved unknown protein [Ectocarpus siliculosus]|eukprot:CBN75109.1 conserved unknown protein [Ectocarpus siliculosus]
MPMSKKKCPTLVVDDAAPPSQGKEDEGVYAVNQGNNRGELRSSCDRCWVKKRRCPGGQPCLRCRRGSHSCSYSAKRKLGRPPALASPINAGAVRRAGDNGVSSISSSSSSRQTQQQQQQQQQQHGNVKREQRQQHGPVTEKHCSEIVGPSFSSSSATGLGGLQESSFLECFLKHCSPMCAVADERSVRQGLVHAFVSRWTTTASASEASPIDKLEVMRGSAVECTLFSAMAIGGLMLGCPTVTVARHLAAARQCLGRFRSGLCEQSAVAALILYGLANALLPPCDGDGQREYRSSMDDAQEMFGSLEPQDPFVNAFMTYRGTCDNLVAFMPDSLYSVNPVNISGRRGGVTAPAHASTSGGADGGEGGGDQVWKTPGGAMTAGAKQGADAMRVSSAKPAHPAYVVADSMTLVLRFVCMEGDVRTGWANVHDLISSELNRLFKEQAGALVLTTLAGNLIAAKSRIGTSEGMLPVAEIVLAMFCKCPGLLRKSFDALRALVVAATEQAMVTFDEFGVGVAICSTDQGRGGSGNDSLPVAAAMGLSSGAVGLGVTVEASAAAPPRRRRPLSPRHGGTSGTPKFMAAAAAAAPVPSYGGGVASSDSRPGWEQFGAGGGSGSGSGGGGGGGSRWTRRRDGELFDDSTPREPWTLASGTAGGRSQAGGGGRRDKSDGGNVYGYPPLAPGPHHPYVQGRLPVSSPAAGGWAGSARASRTEATAEQQHGFLDASSSCAPVGVDQKMLQSVLPPSAASASAAAASAGGNGGRDFVKEPPQQSLWKQEGCPRGSESDEAMAIRIGGGSGSGSGGGGGGGGGEPQHYHQLQLDEAVNVGIGGGDSWGAAVRGDDAGGGGRVVGDGTDRNRHVGGGGGRGGGGSGDGGGGEAGGAVCADLVGMLLDD